MVNQRAVLLTSFAALLTACEKDPTGTLPVGGPLLASAGSPRFTEATGTAPGATGVMSVAFKMSGVGSKAANVVTATGDADALWACRFGSLEFDGWPAPQLSSEVASGSSALSMKNGQVSGIVSLSTPATPLTCAAANRTAVLISTSFDGVQVTHAEAGSIPVVGTFNRTFFTLPTETLPVVTDAQLSNSVLTIEGAPVDYTATINNPGPLLSPISVQAWITQGSTFRAAGGASVSCTGPLSGELPTGVCQFSWTAGARNDPAAGSGTLVPGPAVLELNVRGSPSVRVLAGWRFDITLQ